MFHRRLRFSVLAAALVAPSALAQGTPGAGAAPAQPAPAPAAPAPAPAAPAPPGSPPPAGAPAAPPAGAPIQEAPQQGGPVPYYQESSTQTPKIYVEQPPLPPLPPRNRYFHDGFYLRLSAGYAYMNTSTGVTGSQSTASLSGHGVALDVMMGGTPAPGLVVGGGLLLEAAFDPTSTVTQYQGQFVQGLDNGASGTTGFGLVGPMIDAFPNPNGGFHLGALLGFAAVGLKGHESNISSGFGASIWAGYMWWTTSQWSMGLMARFTLAGTSRTLAGDTGATFDASDTSAGAAVLLSVAYH